MFPGASTAIPATADNESLVKVPAGGALGFELSGKEYAATVPPLPLTEPVIVTHNAGPGVGVAVGVALPVEVGVAVGVAVAVAVGVGVAGVLMPTPPIFSVSFGHPVIKKCTLSLFAPFTVGEKVIIT